MESKIFLLVFAIMVSNSDGRSLHKRAAFYIANETACVVDNTVYYNGDPIPTDDPCEACKCRPPGFACVLKDCEVKPGCRAVRRAGHCCPEYVCGCEHNGRMYRDGDEIRDSQNPCYTCHCQGSAIACAFVDCFFRVDCAPRYVNGECCPRYDHCTSTDPTANASFPTEPTFAGRIPTSSIADEVKGSTNADEKLLITTLAPIFDVHIQGSSLDPPNEVKTFFESSVEYANPFGPTITDYTTTEKRTESPDVVTLVYEKENLSGGESESDDAVVDSVSDDNAEQVDSSNPEDTEKEKSPEVLGFHNAEHDGSSELSTKSQSKPKEPVATATNLDEPNGKEENLDSSAPKSTEITSSTESSTAPIDIKNAQEEPNTILEKSKDSTSSSEQPQEEYKASSHGELTTLTPPIPLVYLHYNKGDSSKKSQSSTDNDLNQEVQRDGVQPDSNDSVANEISFTTQSQEEENLLSPKGTLESDRKPKEKFDKDDETSSTEDTPQKPEESEHKDDAEENETKQDRGLKTASKSSNDSDVQQVEQQLPDVSSTVLDQQPQQQQLSTPTSVQEIPKQQEDESKQIEVLKQSNAGENKQSIKTVIRNDKEAQKFEKQDDISSSPEEAVQELQSPEPSTQVTKSQETLDEQEQQNVQNAEQIIHKSDQNDDTQQIQANKDRSIKTASSSPSPSPSEKEPEEIQHQYEITAPSVETTLDEAGQSVSVPQETEESIDEIKQEIPTKEEDSQVEDTQDDSKRDFNVETVSSTISSSSEATTQEPKQETFSIASIVSTTLNEDEPLVAPTHDEKLSDSVGKEKKGSVNRKGIIHDGEDKDVVNTEEEISKQDRSVKTANKAGEQVAQNDGTVYPSTKVAAEEQEPSTPASEQESGEEQKFPTWEEIRHYQENGQTGDHSSRQDKSVKTGSTAVSDEGGQNPEEQGDITFSSSETTIKEDVSTTPAFQYTESEDTSNVGKPETVNIKGIHQSTEKRGNENDAGQDDSKEDKSEEISSKQEAQEPSQQLDDVTQLPLETIADQGTQPSTLLSQKTKPKGNVAFQTEDTKQDRSVKTASTSKSDSQEEAQHSDIGPTEESQQLTSPSSIKTQNEVQKGGEPSFPSWVEIHHKFQGNDQISARIHYESRQDRSIKTGDSSVSDAVTLGSAQEEESTSLLPETTSDDDDPPSKLVEQTTKSPEYEEKKEGGSKTRIIYNSGQHSIKSGAAQEVSEQDKSIKTSSKDETKSDTPEPERLDVVEPSTTEPTASYEQHLKSEQDDSKKDRSVKTASKESSRTEIPQTIQQDGISTVSTEIILDEQQQQQQQQQQEQLTTPSSQKVSPKEKSQDEQKFPSWEEINYENEETDDHSRQSRSVKTSSSSSVDKEAQAQNTDSDVTITPTIQITLENNEEQTTKVQDVEYQASVDDGKPETVSKKGFHQKSEQDENKDNVAADESKKDRSVKTGSKGTSQTEEQETVRQDEVTPSSTVTSVDEGQALNPQSHPSDENSEQPRFPTWDEISHRYERNSHISREGRSAKTATKGSSETEPQIEQQHGVAPGTPSDYDKTSSSENQNTKSTIGKQSQETADEKEIAHQPEESKNKGILENHDTKKDRRVKTGTRDTTKAGAQETVKQDEVIATSTNSPPEKQKQFSNLESQSSKEKNSEQPRFPTWDEISHRYERKNQKTATRPDQNEKAANNDLSGVESQKQTAEQQNNAFTETSLGDTTLVTLVFDTTKYGDDVGEKRPESEYQRKNADNTPTTESQSIVDHEKPKEDRSVKTASKSTSQEETQGIQETDDIRTSPAQAILSDELITTPTPQIIKSQGNEQEEQGFPISEESHKSQESENSETDLKQDISITAESQSKTDAQKEQEQQVDIALPPHETTTDYYAPSSAAPQNAEIEIQDSLKGENQTPVTHQEPVREPQKQESETKVQPGISRKGRDIKTSVKAEGQTDYREIQKNDDVKPEQQEESKTDYQEIQQNDNVKPEQQEESKTDYQEIQQNDDVKPEQQEDSKTDSQQTQNNDDTQAEQQGDITLPQQETPTDHYIPTTTFPQTEEIGIQDSLKGENKNPTKVPETIQEPQKQNNEAKIRPVVSTKGRDIKTSGKTAIQTNSQETQQNEDVKPKEQEDSQTDSQETQQNEDVKPEQQEDSQIDSAETQLNEDRKQQQQEDITLPSQETSTDHYGQSTAAPPNAEIGIQNSLKGENQEPTNDQKTISEPQKQENEDKIRPGGSRKGRDIKTSGKKGSQTDFQETQQIEAGKPEQLEDSQTDSQETQQNEAEKSEQLEDTQTDSQKTQQNEAEKSEQLEDTQTDTQETQQNEDGKSEKLEDSHADSQEIHLSDDGKQEQEDITLPSQEASTYHYELSTAAPQNSEIEFQDRLKGEYQKPTNDQDTILEPQKQESESNTKPGGSRKGRDIKTSSKAAIQANSQETQQNEDKKPEQQVEDSQETQQSEDGKSEQQEDSQTDSQDTQQDEIGKAEQQEDSQTDSQDAQKNEDGKPEQQEDSRTDSQQTQLNDDRKPEQQEDIIFPSQGTPTDHYEPSTSAPQNAEIGIQHSLEGETQNPTNHQETVSEPQKQESEGKIGPGSSRKGRDIKTSGKTASQTNSQETQQTEDVKPQQDSQTNSQETLQNEDVKPQQQQQQDSQTDSQETQQNEDVKPQQQQDSQTNSQQTLQNEDVKPQQQQQDSQTNSQETQQNEDVKPQQQQQDSQTNSQETQQNEDGKPEQEEDSQTYSQDTQKNENGKSKQQEDSQTDSQETEQNEDSKPEQQEESQTDSHEKQLNDDEKPEQQEDIAAPSITASTDGKGEIQDSLKGENQKPTNDEEIVSEPQKQESDDKVRPGVNRKGRDIKTSVRTAGQTGSQETQQNSNEKPQQQIDITLSPQETTTHYYEASTTASQNAEIQDNLQEENQKPTNDQETIREQQKQENEDKVRPRVTIKGQVVKTSGQTQNEANLQESLDNNDGQQEQQEDSQADSKETQQNDDGKPENQEDSQTDSQEVQLNDDGKPEQEEDITFPSEETTPDHYEPSTVSSQNAEIQDSLGEENQRPASDQQIIREPQKQGNEDKIRPGGSRKGRDAKTSVKTQSQKNADSQKEQQNDDEKPVLNPSVSQTEQQTTPAQNPNPENQEFPRWEEIIHKSEDGFQGSLDEENGSKQSRNVKKGTNRVSASVAQNPEEQKSATSSPQETTPTEQFTSVNGNEAQQLKQQNSFVVPSEKTSSEEQSPSREAPQTTLSNDQSNYQQEQENKGFTTTSTSPADVKEGEKDSNTKSQDFEEDTSKSSVAQET